MGWEKSVEHVERSSTCSTFPLTSPPTTGILFAHGAGLFARPLIQQKASLPMKYRLDHLRQLEAESIHIMREVAAEFENPVMLYSVGKDSSVMVRLAMKSFHPSPVPFPLLHVDTGMKFQEMYSFRDDFCTKNNLNLQVYKHPKTADSQVKPWLLGTQKCCASLKTAALLNALSEGKYDAAFGGARREEERSRAKERIYSFRDVHGQWDPKNQRPELWNIYNGRHDKGETIRVFPISNWTELDIWLYIWVEKIPVVPMYFAKEREMVVREGQLIPVDGPLPLEEGEKLEPVMCRFRTLGCYPCTGAVYSDADTVEKIVEELMVTRNSERITRVIDHDTDGSMEIKKREGYF